MFTKQWFAGMAMAVGLGTTPVVIASPPLDQLPRDVADFVERSERCNWMLFEEESGDIEEIGSAVKELECGRLDGDEARLRRKYGRDNEILHVIDQTTDVGC